MGEGAERDVIEIKTPDDDKREEINKINFANFRWIHVKPVFVSDITPGTIRRIPHPPARNKSSIDHVMLVIDFRKFSGTSSRRQNLGRTHPKFQQKKKLKLITSSIIFFLLIIHECPLPPIGTPEQSARDKHWTRNTPLFHDSLWAPDYSFARGS